MQRKTQLYTFLHYSILNTCSIILLSTYLCNTQYHERCNVQCDHVFKVFFLLLLCLVFEKAYILSKLNSSMISCHLISHLNVKKWPDFPEFIQHNDTSSDKRFDLNRNHRNIEIFQLKNLYDVIVTATMSGTQ